MTKSRKQGYDKSTKETLAEKPKNRPVDFIVIDQSTDYTARFYKTKKLGSHFDETSIKPNLNDSEIEFDYFDYDKVIAEPGLYSCQDSSSCLGRIETEHGYYLNCWKCSKQ
jgi:hypothetical protein